MTLVSKPSILNGMKHNIHLFLDEENNVWFKAEEIAIILEYKNPKRAISIIVDKKDQKEWSRFPSTTHVATPSNWQTQTIFINIHGLTQLTMKCNNPKAKMFKRWVFKEFSPFIPKDVH
ncbi:hypothetical protein CDAR_304901 [Caerostris darwini]|uniref:Bro-N domain-containing protein n=1 Tax=Caerostris darwini TaxID=1538125 RepID=A0AAV4Q4R3_9ARAC|nr:hypothetical protein CDAR_304901 [Caerostris darwini]